MFYSNSMEKPLTKKGVAHPVWNLIFKNLIVSPNWIKLEEYTSMSNKFCFLSVSVEKTEISL